jgi:hypothetical protein
MKRSDVLEKSRKSNYDEGKENLIHKARSYGFISYYIISLYLIIIMVFKLILTGKTDFFSLLTVTMIALSFSVGEFIKKYLYSKKALYLIATVSMLITILLLATWFTVALYTGNLVLV